MSRSERAKLRNLKRGGASSSDDEPEQPDQDDDDDQEMRDDQIAEDMDEESASDIQGNRRKLNESSDSVQEIRKPVGRSTRRGRALY